MRRDRRRQLRLDERVVAPHAQLVQRPARRQHLRQPLRAEHDAVHRDDGVVDLDEAVRLRLAAGDEANDFIFHVELDAEARGAAAELDDEVHG